MIGFSYCDEAVVSDLFLSAELFAFDHANKAGPDSNAGESRLIHQKKNVDGISVWCNCLRQEPEVVRKGHPGREDLLQHEYLLMRIEGEFIAAAGGRLDDDLDHAILLADRFEMSRIGQRFHLSPGTPR